MHLSKTFCYFYPDLTYPGWRINNYESIDYTFFIPENKGTKNA